MNKSYRWTLRNILNLFPLILISTSYLLPQESQKHAALDSLQKKPIINQTLLHSFEKEFILPGSMGDSEGYIPPSLHQALILSPSSLSSQFQQQIDLNSPWKQELAEQNRYHTLRSILGAVQAGGTAYILYEHIKKYGLK